MNDERWHTAWALFESASQLPPEQRRGFIEQTSSDPEIVRSVLDLLDEEAAVQPNSRAGRRVGRYRVVEQIGQGGMGEVYSAEDKELGRTVALKFLSVESGFAQGGVDRVVREARAASALNHPNIVTVHEVVQSDAGIAIAMEFIEGKSLREYCGAPVPAMQVAQWGRQIAQALAAAHACGLIHRDIKPENLMVRKDGYIKVLDFGLARWDLAELSAGSHSIGLGGTFRYMAPEQTRGERPSTATDVFALGIVLHELLAGSHPFAADSAMDTAHAIAHNPPRRVPPRLPVPNALAGLIDRMLSKDSRQRPAAAEIELLLTRLDAAVPAKPRFRGRWLAASLGMAAAGALAVFLLRNRILPPAAPEMRQITTQTTENRVTAAALSPNGRSLAFAAFAGPVYLRRMSDGFSHALATPAGLRVDRIAWFADGTKLLVSASLRRDRTPGIWAMPVDNAQAHLLVRDGKDGVPSPDGSRIAFISPDGATVRTADADGGSPSYVRGGGSTASFSALIWSPDSKRVAYQRRDYAPPRARQVDRDSSLFEKHYEFSYESVEVETGRVVASAPNFVMTSACALPDGRVLFLRWVAPDQALVIHVWEQRTDPSTGKLLGPPRALTRAPLPLSSISAANDGKQIVVERAPSQLRPNIYVADLPAAGQVPRFLNIRRLTFTEADDYPHAWTSDNQAVIFESSRNGKYDLFRQDARRPEAEPLVVSSGDNVLAQLSPDGKWILYRSMQGIGKWALMRVPAGGGGPEPVPINRKLDEFQCALRPEARCVLRSVENDAFVYRELDPVRGEGRELARTVWSPTVTGDWALSPDGTEVAIPNHNPHDAKIRLVPLTARTSGAEKTITLIGLKDLNGVSWAADGQGWYACVRTGFGGLLVYADRQGRTSELLDSVSMPWVVPSRDGRHVAFPRQIGSSNAWLLRGF